MAMAMDSENNMNEHNQNKSDLNGHKTDYSQPLKSSGTLEKFDYEDVTPCIGREFPSLNVVDDLLNSSNADDMIRDLAVNISQRCVVFFRSQDNLTEEQQKYLINRLGELSGKPESSTFFVNPVQPTAPEPATKKDPEISRISSVGRGDIAATMPNPRRFDEALWHADGQFELFPPSFTSLRLSQTPKTGGDTLWASGYELYDRCSNTYQRFLEGLTCTFIGDGYLMAADKFSDRFKIHESPRGNPNNVGKALTSVHPVVRTHPVSGWKNIFAVGPTGAGDFGAPKYINELNKEESAEMLQKFYDMILRNHDLTVRFKWKNSNDMAIWDNRCALHSATFDYDNLGDRAGVRVAGVGEKPYFDANSKSRTEALTAEGGS